MNLNLPAILLSLSGCSIVGCASAEAPNWEGKIWDGNAKLAGIERRQEGQFIPANDKRFDDYAALSYSDLSCLYQTFVLNCKEWIDMTPQCKSVDPVKVQEIIKKYGR